MPVVTSSLKVKMENCTVWKKETARKSSPNLGMIRVHATLKEEGRATPTKNVFVVDALATSEPIAEPRLALQENLRNPRPGEKGFGNCEKEKQKSSKNVSVGIIDLGSFQVLSHHGETKEDNVVVDESSEGSTRAMPPLPPVSWFKERRISKHAEMRCGKFRKHCNVSDCPDGEESSFFDCRDWRYEQSDSLQHADPWAQNEPKSVSSSKGCLPVNFPVCSVCQKLGVYNQHLPLTSSPVRHPL